MERVFDAEQRRFEDIRGVAVAIAELGDDQRHLGLLHRDAEAGPVLMLDLQWHHRLRNDPPSDDFLWIDPAVHSRRLAQVADICRLIWRANQKDGIPYGFSSPTDCFDDETGAYLFGPTALGLTCATFVLAVFHRAGLPLVVYESWPTERPGDRPWQEKIVQLLERTGAATEHVAAVRSEIGSVRFRPEEVAGAATCTTLPALFDQASGRAQHILDRLQIE
jgi:hypothetical protein